MGWPSRKVLITARGSAAVLGRKAEKDVIAWTDKHTLSSLNPPLYMISLPREHYVSELISKENVFVVNMFEKKEDIHEVEKYDGRVHDQFDILGLQKGEAQTIDCPIIKEADHHIECEVVETIPTGDTITFIGKMNKGLK